MNILIFGGTGMLGIPVTFKLKLLGHQIKLFTRNPGKASLIFGNLVEIIHGDILNNQHLHKAIQSTQAIHINLSGDIEDIAVEKIASAARNHNIKKITYISGDSVCPENAWFPMVKRKLLAEEHIENSGIPFTIFRPTWFMESIPKFIRQGRAYFIGKKDLAFHLVAAEDYSLMVSNSINNPATDNKKLYIHGPEKLSLAWAIEQYYKTFYPRIKSISYRPPWMMAFVAFLLSDSELTYQVKLMRFFSMIGEIGDGSQTNEILGPPQITFRQWLEKRKKLEKMDFHIPQVK